MLLIRILVKYFKQRFKESLTRVSVLANEKFKGVTFDIHNDLLKITANNPDHDEAEEELVIDYQGEAMTIAFNASYLLDAVANLDADVALLNIANDVSTCFIQEPNQEAFKFIVMPMRL
jgi:DNA polymerase-3 subunit beta